MKRLEKLNLRLTVVVTGFLILSLVLVVWGVDRGDIAMYLIAIVSSGITLWLFFKKAECEGQIHYLKLDEASIHSPMCVLSGKVNIVRRNTHEELSMGAGSWGIEVHNVTIVDQEYTQCAECGVITLHVPGSDPIVSESYEPAG